MANIKIWLFASDAEGCLLYYINVIALIESIIEPMLDQAVTVIIYSGCIVPYKKV